MLSAADYRSILAILEDCAPAEDVQEFRSMLLTSVARRLGYDYLTFFLGQHPMLELELRDPVMVGVAEPLIDQYLISFASDDVFATEDARTRLRLHGLACLPQLLDSTLGPDQEAYVREFLVPNGISDKVMVWLDTELPVHGFLGVIGLDGSALDKRTAAILSELRPHLGSHLRRLLRVDAMRLDTGPLTIREHQVARFIADGWTNRAISKHLGISESTTKKHTSKVLAKLRLHSRTELAAAWRPGSAGSLSKEAAGQ